ncbi:MAG TPA: PIN domain-containing protein [Candidatus Nanoarchaeia archaeon]|nr:PIN domain-containing protein [Candidatus Nanoarchaeia archaeon]
MKESTETLFLVDTNVLVYAYDRTDQRKHHVAALLVEKCWRREVTYAVSIQNLAEFFVVMTQKSKVLPVEEAQQIIKDILEFSNWKVFNYNSKTLQQAISIFKHKQRHFWDALIAATMTENGVLHIYTENVSDFKEFEGIHAVNPFK